MAWVAIASVITVFLVGILKPEFIDQIQLAQAVAEGIGAAMCLRAARYTRGRARATWALFASGLIIWCATDAAFGLSALLGHASPGGISIFDAFWLAFYVPMLAAVGIAANGLRTERGWQWLLDSALIATAVLVFAWVTIIKPAALDSSEALVVAAVDSLYPTLDLLAIVSLGWLMLRLGAASPAWLRIVAVAFGMQATADLSYLASDMLGSRIEALSAAVFTAAGWTWAIAARIRMRSPQRVWTAPSRSMPPLWSQLVPIVIGMALAGLLMTELDLWVTTAAVLGVAIMIVRLVSTVLLDRSLLAERRAVADLRGALLAEERYARESTEQARAALALQNERLMELDRMKDEFVAMVSHEFRTPITAIQNYVHAVMEGELGPLQEPQHRFLGVAQRNTARLSRLVEDLLLFARIQDGRLTLDLDEMDLGILIAESLESASVAADQVGVRLQRTGATTVIGKCDGGRIAQVLDNLISNAIKFTPSGGLVHVDVHASADAVIIEVADTGPGIDPDEMERLFTPFFRTRHATANAVPGTGLGLAISRAIVESHGGAISVRRGDGHGTVVRVCLPTLSGGRSAPNPLNELVTT